MKKYCGLIDGPFSDPFLNICQNYKKKRILFPQNIPRWTNVYNIHSIHFCFARAVVEYLFVYA